MQDRDRSWSPWVRRPSPTPSADGLELDGIPLADLRSKGGRDVTGGFPLNGRTEMTVVDKSRVLLLRARGV